MKLKSITFSTLLVLVLFPTNFLASDIPDSAWRFLLLADWHSAEKYIFANGNKQLESIQEDINTVKWLKHNIGGELIVLPGDTNGGHWDTKKFRQRFAPDKPVDEVILAAGKLCYEGMLDSFRIGGYDKLLLATGDHEMGDNPWPIGSDVAKYQAEFRYSLAQAFNYDDQGEFKYQQSIGDAPSRPMGTTYQDTSYAYQHKNALFITLDAFHQVNYKQTIGKEGSVTGTITGKHLRWLESVLAAANTSETIKHIFVQSHLPVLSPVRKVSSSGMLMDDGANSEMWQLLRDYNVDVYFAGEVHANTVIKDSESDLLQVVTRGNFFDNFTTVDITDEKITLSLFRHFGEKTSDGKYQQSGLLSIDKTREKTTIEANGDFAILEPKSRLLHYTFEQDHLNADKPINGLKERKNNFILDGLRCDRLIPNVGTFGDQYGALHCNVTLVDGLNGKAGAFNSDSRMASFAMGPLEDGVATAIEISFKTKSNENQILINTASIWGIQSKNFLNMYLDNGILNVATSDRHLTRVLSDKLNDDQWHTVKIQMPNNNSKLSELEITVDGRPTKHNLVSQDSIISVKHSMRFTVGGRGYSTKALKNVDAENFVGLIDNVSLWVL